MSVRVCRRRQSGVNAGGFRGQSKGVPNLQCRYSKHTRKAFQTVSARARGATIPTAAPSISCLLVAVPPYPVA